jgi:hypothetical protein
MTKALKIALYGDSLALPRKGVVNYNERYFFLLEQWLRNHYEFEYLEIKDRAKGAIIVNEILAQYDHDLGYFDFPADIAVFHTGIVDCAPRPINENTRQIVAKLPSWIKNRVINYLHKNRSKILQKGKFYVKTEKELFHTTLKKIVSKATQDYKRVYFITICPTNHKTENHSPGFTKNINEYNNIIKNVFEETEQSNLFLIDINKYINDRYLDIDKYVLKDDGHHITALTHSIIANQIIENEITYI